MILTRTFNVTGATAAWVVPWHTPGTLTAQVVGGSGGGMVGSVGGSGGAGGRGNLTCTLNLTPGQALTVAVGYGGTPSTAAATTPGGTNPLAGYDGGNGGSSASNRAGAAGGAASVLLLGGSPLVIAGGGGGASWGAFSSGRGGYTGGPGIGPGAGGGGQTAFSGGNGDPGTLFAAGAGGPGPTGALHRFGSPGVGTVGGSGYVSPDSSAGGGGGGGGYWGAGGGGGQAGTNAGAGGGGSTWADTGVCSGFSNFNDAGYLGLGPYDGYIVFTWEYAVGTGCVPVAQTVSSATTGTRSFTYTGSNQSWKVPGHVPGSLRVMVGGGVGGSNGSSGTAGERGGDGGYIRGVLNASIGSSVMIALGGPGQNGFSAAAGVDWPHAAGGGGPRPGGQGGTLGSHSYDSFAVPRRSSGGGGGGSELYVNGTLVAVAGGGSGGAIHAGTGISNAYPGSAQTGSGGQSGGASTAHPGGTDGNDGFGGTTAGPGLGGGAAAAKWPTYVEDGWPGVAGVGGAGGSMIHVPGSSPGGSLVGGGSGGGGGYYGGGGGGGTYLLGTGGTGGGGSSWSNSGYITEATGFPSPASSTVTFTWTPITNGIYLTGDPDALDLWPNNAYIPGGLPVGSTLISQFVVELTATTTLTTAGSERLAVLDSTLGPTGPSLPGTWSGAAGSITTISGIDYYVLTNWTGSQTVTFDFATPTRLDEFMAWVDRPLSGAVRVDGWCLYGPTTTNKVSVGMLLAN